MTISDGIVANTSAAFLPQVEHIFHKKAMAVQQRTTSKMQAIDLGPDGYGTTPPHPTTDHKKWPMWIGVRGPYRAGPGVELLGRL